MMARLTGNTKFSLEEARDYYYEIMEFEMNEIMQGRGIDCNIK